MSPVKHILLSLIAGLTLSAHSAPYETLTFVKQNGGTIAFSANELVITYDDFAHAVVSNDEVTGAIVDLADVDYMCFGEVEDTSLKGDVNSDGEVNVADINAVIDMVLSSRFDTKGDVNGDGEINIADINAVIDLILSN